MCSVGCILSQLLSSVKKIKQEVLLDQCCLHLAKCSIKMIINYVIKDTTELLIDLPFYMQYVVKMGLEKKKKNIY